MEMAGLKGETMDDGFLRHVRACNNAVLPGERLAFRIGGAQVGWVKPDVRGAAGGVSGDPHGQ